MSPRYPFVFLFSITAVTYAGLVFAAVEKSILTSKSAKDYDKNRYQYEPIDLNWVSQPWTGSDKPFNQIKKEVKRLEVEKKLTGPMIQKLHDAAIKAPKDPKAQFRWGYATFRAPYNGVTLGKYDYSIYHPVAVALGKPQNPHSREYDRLRFLVTTLYYSYTKLKVVGERLFQSDPDDGPVKTYLIDYLAVSRQAADRKRAIKLGQELVTQYPKSPDSHLTLAIVYRRALFSYGDTSAADKGIASYQRYLALLPSDAEKKRLNAVNAIKKLQKEKQHQLKHGFEPPLMAG